MTRILVADDEEFERRALCLILSRSGIPELEVLTAANGREAVEAAARARPDLAILDLRMPGMDGLEAARRLREGDPELPVLFLTAFETFDYAREAARIGVEDYLVKPAGPEEVVAAVSAALARAQERRARSERAREDARDATRLSGFLEDELREDLARGRLEEGRLEEYLEVRRLASRWAFCASLKLSRSAGVWNEGENAQAALRRLCESARAVLIAHAYSPLLGVGEREARLLAFAPEGCAVSARDADLVLTEVLARCRTELSLAALCGASAPVSGASAALCASADAALRAARPERPLVILAHIEAGKTAPGGRESLVARALRLLDERRAENLGLEEAASELRVSPFHLSRVLKERTGEGFAERLARLRVERAKGYLATGLYSVKEASALSGFGDPAYCARVFRKIEGLSPSEYRRRVVGST